MTTVILYTTAGCHLCDQAEGLLQQVALNHALTITATEIGDDDLLVENYAVRIPVLRKSSGEELYWPFNLADIESFISPS